MKNAHSHEEETQEVQPTDGEYPKEPSSDEDGAVSSHKQKKKDGSKKKTDIESVIKHVMGLLTLEQGVP